MCGITGYVGDGDAVETLLSGLGNLEYRGYDSAGIAVENGCGITVEKREGELENLEGHLEGVSGGDRGIGHTRWSTHGRPSDRNAHPHTDCTGRVAVVHNGVVENYDTLKASLAEDHTFTSETDTEVIPHLIEAELDAGHPPKAAFRRAIRRLEGSFAVAAMVEGTDAILATRKGSPLVLGLNGSEAFVASDVPAFLDHTDEVIYLEDRDVAVLEDDGWHVTDLDGRRVDRGRETVDWTAEDAERKGYDHYMLKEIHEQPLAIERTLRGRVDETSGHVALEDVPEGAFADVSTVQFLACGTSYHAAMYAQELLHRVGIPATVFRAGEYATSPAPVTENTLVVAVTQSGETADTLQSLRSAVSRGARTLAVTNVVGSTAAREADETAFIRAGPEIGVAATKTFSSQVVTLSLLVERFLRDSGRSLPDDRDERAADLRALPEDLRSVLGDDGVADVVDRFEDAASYFFVGRGVGHPVALEGALKFKEITYEHAEGFSAGQLKHGPLALVTRDTPVFAVFTGDHVDKTLGNVEEVQARDAPVVGITSEGNDRVRDRVDHALTYPDTHPAVAGVLANAHLQRVSYLMADRLNRPIDKPRNLAKSVTVE